MQADPNKIARLLRTAQGQLEGILKMVEEDRYCLDAATGSQRENPRRAP